MFAAIGIFSFNFRVALPLLVTRSLHGTEVGFTMLYAVSSSGGVVGALLVAHRKFVKLRHIIGASLALGLAMLALAATPNVYAAAPAVFLVGGAGIVYMTATTSLAQVDTRRDMVGRVLALPNRAHRRQRVRRRPHRRPPRRPRRWPRPHHRRRPRLPARRAGRAGRPGAAPCLRRLAPRSNRR